MLGDQMFNMGSGNPGGMMPIQQQQQHGSQDAFCSMASNAQNLQSGIVTLQNTQQNHTNFSQQRQQNPVIQCAFINGLKCCKHNLETSCYVEHKRVACFRTKLLFF